MKTEIAKRALWETHGGLSLERSAVIQDVCPMAVYRLVCAMGRSCLVKLLTRCHLPLPQYFIADEKHSHYLDKRVYLPTIGCGRVIWHLGYTTAKSVECGISVDTIFETVYHLMGDIVESASLGATDVNPT